MSKNGRGFVTFAQNTDSVNYLELAYLQALNIKTIHPFEKYAVIVDNATNQKINDKHNKVFDYVIQLPYDENNEFSTWKLANEYQVFDLTPFKETIKVECDLLFTRTISHWWNAFRLRDLVLNTGCKNYRQESATSRTYRKFFDDNELPDIYNGLMYFRFSQVASEFFLTAKRILRNWEYLKVNVLKNCREENPSTDVLYALAAKTLGIEKCTIPTMNFLNFVHMKPAINNWGDTSMSWQDMVLCETDNNMIRINNLNQYNPVHYHEKSYATEELINYYERAYYNSLSQYTA